MDTSTILRGLLVASLLQTAACDLTEPTAPGAALSVQPDMALASLTDPAPSPLVNVSGGSSSLEFWPYTGTALGGPPSDPMNLVFPDVDIRSVRAALMMLDGNRTAYGFPAVAPFNCTWKEAMGANQTGYATPSGWTGSAIQLECGDYGPVRFHLRLFSAGDWTIANGHFEVQVQGTNAHEVLSWELAKQLVTVDMVRSGVLGAAPAPTGLITPTPTYRTINPSIYNLLPAALKTLTGGPSTATAPVPIANDGRAMILRFAGDVQGERSVAKREFVLNFNQTIPKPFCVRSPYDYLRVTGPIDFSQQVVVSGSGNFISRFHARGQLQLIPVNPLTGAVGGDTLTARVMEHDRSVVTDQVTLVAALQLQVILPVKDLASGSMRATLHVGPGGSDHDELVISCAS
ncbi:MAG: hypothetical protein EXR91_01805 [Gemmatimonadetes bacterium]|nr:hypothetical protein [Gemmatimonadota bacterium]